MQSSNQVEKPETDTFQNIEGGRTTNRPPANVAGDYKVLSSGVDTLFLAISGSWENGYLFFEHLNYYKDKAKENNKEIGIEINSEISGLMQPSGAGGYEWLITGKEYSLRIGNWSDMKQRPNLAFAVCNNTILHE